jgi:DNA-binding transcriptional ArsR family regulator
MAGLKISWPASVLGDPTRAAMVMALMDGRFHSAKQLALEAGVAPQTASAHLKKLVESEVLALRSQGRCKYFRIASGEVAAAVEALTQFAAPADRPLPRGARELAFARCCYDHLAGRLGVAVAEGIERLGVVVSYGGDFRLTASGRSFLENLGIDTTATRRPLLRTCTDWTERLPHIGGALGAALLRVYKEKQWLLAVAGSRRLLLTPHGEAELKNLFGLDAALFVADAVKVAA